MRGGVRTQKKDVKRVRGKTESQETEREATYSAEEDADPVGEWSAQEEREECILEEEEEGDASDCSGEDGDQKRLIDPTTKATGPQVRDPAARHIPGGTCLAQTRKERSRQGESKEEDARPGGSVRLASRCSRAREDGRLREGGGDGRKTLVKAEIIHRKEAREGECQTRKPATFLDDRGFSRACEQLYLEDM
ncbi:hypothetical protein NDU88_003663 [Pleurodeles waltl]|uniref:Uncharacterized protein n=1 Tax=Pleurodeles waltl TaxID=8319 RepID=A0AAV7M7M9_PLEWA|nr:hypothetical protein NDU88_003663 [Pleurodeles waltl]